MKEVIINWASINETQEKYFHPKELVRCKDCKYYEGTCTNYYINDIMVPLGLDGGAEFIPDEDFYCAMGER